MKTNFVRLPFLLTTIALFTSAVTLKAQVYNLYHSFSPIKQSGVTGAQTNQDGGNDYAPLIVSGDTLYGATSGGGTNGLGTIFKINTDGSAFSNIFKFTFIGGQPTNGDNGSDPQGRLTLSGNTLYGITYEGGLRTNYYGSIYAIQTDGSGFTNLHYFSTLKGKTNAEGAFPQTGLALASNSLYGVAYQGGRFGEGTVFAINTDGSGFTNLYNFDGTNGANPFARLCSVGSRLYGTTYDGGAFSNGVIFGINDDGSGFTNYHNFSALSYPYSTNVDGAHSQSALEDDGNILYGATALGGSGYGTLFSINTDGSGFTPFYYFNYYQGYSPYGQLLFTNNLLYGTTTGGGTNGTGTVFSISPGGSDHNVLYAFQKGVYSGSAYTNSSGFEPWAGVVMADNTLFGVTPTGGSGGSGTIYALTLAEATPIILGEQTSGKYLILNWANPAVILEAASNVGGPYTPIPGATSPFTAGTTNPQQFFRLQTN